MNWPAPAGRVCIGAAAAGSGVMQIVNADFVRLVAKPAAWFPASAGWPAVAGGLVLVLAGAAILSGRRLRPAALTLGAMLLAALLLRLPEIMARPGAGFVWTNPAKILAMLGGALRLADRPARAPALAAGLLAVFLLLAGTQHFVYAGFVDTLVPAWIPPGRRFWTCFTGVTLIAGGLGLLLPRLRGWAGLLSGVMIFLWVLLLHVPRSVELKSVFELAGVFEAWGIGGVAWLVAASGGPPPRPVSP